MEKDTLGKYRLRVSPSDTRYLYKLLDAVDVSTLSLGEYTDHALLMAQLEILFDVENEERKLIEDVRLRPPQRLTYTSTDV